MKQNKTVIISPKADFISSIHHKCLTNQGWCKSIKNHHFGKIDNRSHILRNHLLFLRQNITKPFDIYYCNRVFNHTNTTFC